MKEGTPLVSIILISYHSQDTILETLDSIYAQTYQNIELVLSDDCSKDETVGIAKSWMSSHSDRFVNCVIHVNSVNCGVPSNVNSGIRLSAGEFIKIIAADDILLPECIEKNVSCCLENGYNNLSSRVYPFCIRNGKKILCPEICPNPAFFEKDPVGQYKDMLVEHQILSPTFFVSRALLDEMGLYDTRFRFMEDYPMNLKIPKSGHQLHFLDDYTVEYRLSDSSLSNQAQSRVIHPGYHQTAKSFFYKVRLPGLLRYGKLKRVLGEMRRFFYSDLIILLGNNRQIGIVRFLENAKNRKIFKKG